MKKRLLLLIAISAFVFNVRSFGQDEKKIDVFTPAQMRANWEKFSKDEGFSALLKDAKTKGFMQVINEKAMYGYEGVSKDENGKEQPVLFCAYDLYNPKAAKGQGCSMVWKKVGNRVYKAYLIFPEGERDFDKAMGGAMEWYADDNAKIQRAHSWGTCFAKCVKTDGKAPGLDVDIKNGKVKIGGSTYTLTCTTACFTGAIACSAVAGIVAASGAGVPFAIGLLLTCAGLSCAPCAALCAIGCM
jgi:hypothetical protein